MKRCFVTGGAGFIGSHIVDMCLARGCQVMIYDNFSYGRRDNVSSAAASIAIVEGDITDTSSLSKALEAFAPDTIFHMAAIHHIPTCELRPQEAIRTNVLGTQSLLDSIAGSAAPVQRLVLASTGALYANVDAQLVEHETPVKAQNIYSVTKKACEDLLRLSSQKQGYSSVAARIFNAVGRRETNDHLVPAIVRQLKEGTTLRLGNLEPKRSYIHVEDLAAGLVALATADVESSFDIYNVGVPEEHSVLDVIRCFEVLLGTPLEVSSETRLKRANDRMHQRADVRRIQSATGWSARRTLEDAIRDVLVEAGLL